MVSCDKFRVLIQSSLNCALKNYMHNHSKVNGSKVTYGVKGEYVCIFRLFRENMTLSIGTIITRLFFVKAKIDLVVGSMLLIGSRRNDNLATFYGELLKATLP